MSSPTPDGEQLGRYQLVRKLATGGMAEVFLAKAIGPGGFEKQLVIKRILPNLAKDPEFIQMFLAEAKLAAQFAHPAVVQIFDFGEVNGSYFLAMEYVDGPNLRTILRRSNDRKLPFTVGAKIIAEACEGLAYVHEFADPQGNLMGLVHSDVSSDNLLIARNGAVKVVDFGVAKGSGQISNAAPGTVKGKIAYMPPEQIIGEADLRSDVYALGVILYELAAGTKPYENLPDPKLLEAIIKTEPMPLMTRNPATPPEFAMIVGKAMAKNLNVRFQSCRELAAALDDFIAGSGERVGNRHLASLATLSEDPGGTNIGTGSRPVTRTPTSATPYSKITNAGASGKFNVYIPAAPTQPTTPGIAPLIAPVTPGVLPSRSGANPAFVPTPSRSGQAPAFVPAASAPPPARGSADPFAAFGAALERPAAEAEADLALSAAAYDDMANVAPEPDVGMKITLGAAPAPAVSGAFPAFVPGGRPQPSAPAVSGAFPAFVPGGRPQPSAPPPAAAVAPQPAPQAAPPPPKDENEVRAQALMADATAMRLYEAGALLAAQPDLDAIRAEVDKDEGFHLLVRFPRHAARMLKGLPHASGLLAERTTGAVEALLMAEAYGPLASLFERLAAGASLDEHQKWVFDVATAALATADQAHRLAMRLREAPPADADGLGRLLPFFGGAFAPVWLSLSEVVEVPGSRDALLPGLAGLAHANPAPFLERLAEKRPKRLVELVYCLEKGKVRERVPLFKDMLTRLDPQRRREMLTGIARAGTDERVLVQGVTDADEETRLHSIGLIGKHFPERAWKLLEPLLEPSVAETKSDGERRAMWRAVGTANQADGLQAMRDVVTQKGSLLNRGKVEARKLDALEGLGVMKLPGALEVLQQAADDRSNSDEVRNLAQRFARTFDLSPAGGAGIESRRWERTPSTWRDLALDLHALVLASRVMDVQGNALDAAFARLGTRLEALLAREGQGVFTVNGRTLSVNGQALSQGADAPVEQAAASFASRGIATFTLARKIGRPEFEQLIKWLAAGAAAEGITTPNITRGLANELPARPAPPQLTAPAMPDPSREAMIRYVNVILSFRKWLSDRKTNPRSPLPETRQLFFELAAAMGTRSVRFMGLVPKHHGRDAELFHAGNVLLQALAFGAELGLSRQRLIDLATYAFFTDIGNLELKDETFTRAGALTEEDQRDVANARKLSAQFPFVKLGDAPGAIGWAAVVAEQEIDWGAKDRPGALGERANVGLLGSLVALCRAFETLTSTTPRREGMTPDAALDILTNKVPHRFRPELVPLFARFIKRQSVRVLRK